MAHDWQTIATFVIVAAAAAVVARRVFGQIVNMRGSGPDDALQEEVSACSGCGGCGTRKTASQPQIVTISLTAPQRIRAPGTANDSARQDR